eukprot:TRINITY_DN1069_c4_g1_i1.p1 TRINITY_DN1069_c4_g1~~TRINITY_DN1069_c4_g1_i1.p1  ORF type:complete len:503 (+),score=155.52 TRINITY_DN1069_c4_g1_i1:402-1910(+)
MLFITNWILSIPILTILWTLSFIVNLIKKRNSVIQPKVLFITGASSGIGESLAIAYSRPGVVLGLTGRSLQRLESVKDKCEMKGAKVLVYAVDVSNERMKDLVLNFDKEYPIDILIANAGVSSKTSGGSSEEEIYQSVLDTNVTGVLNTVLPIIPQMKQRKRGQIAVTGSLAGFLPGCFYSDAAPYLASKAAVYTLTSAWRSSLDGHGIGVSYIAPGFVESRITDTQSGPLPFMMTGAKAAELIKTGIEKDTFFISFPFLAEAFMWLMHSIPPYLVDTAVFIASNGARVYEKIQKQQSSTTIDTSPTTSKRGAKVLNRINTKEKQSSNADNAKTTTKKKDPSAPQSPTSSPSVPKSSAPSKPSSSTTSTTVNAEKSVATTDSHIDTKDSTKNSKPSPSPSPSSSTSPSTSTTSSSTSIEPSVDNTTSETSNNSSSSLTSSSTSTSSSTTTPNTSSSSSTTVTPGTSTDSGSPAGKVSPSKNNNNNSSSRGARTKRHKKKVDL